MRSIWAWLIASPRHLALFPLLVGVGALALAYIAEFGFGLRPCEMCYWQRIPYAALVVLGGLAMALPAIARPLLWLTLLALIAAVGLGAFHAGVEWKWWQGPGGCSAGITAGMTPAEILAHIQQAAVVSCTDAAVRVLGLSMAGWGAVYALLAAMVLWLGIKRVRG
jgi:disulfide bond formation protein DsbB